MKKIAFVLIIVFASFCKSNEASATSYPGLVSMTDNGDGSFELYCFTKLDICCNVNWSTNEIRITGYDGTFTFGIATESDDPEVDGYSIKVEEIRRIDED